MYGDCLVVTGIVLFILLIAFISPCGARPVDHGGKLDRYVDAVHRATGVHRIAGDCISACTIWLGYKHSCVMRDARLWFHSSYVLSTPKIADAQGNAEMMSFYPPLVQQIVSPWLGTTQLPFAHTLSGKQLIALGVPQCR